MSFRRQLPGIYSSASESYATGAINFNGSTRTHRNGGLTGAVNGGRGILAFWLNMGGSDGATHEIFSSDGGLINLTRTSGNKIEMKCFSPSVSARVSITSATSIINTTGWVHVFCSWDITGVTALGNFWLDGANDSPSTTLSTSSTDIDYTRPDWAIGSSENGLRFFTGDVADMYFNSVQYLDPATDIDKFISGGKLVDLGADGSTPTGSQPIGFWKHTTGDAATDFNINLGSGGNYATETGTLAQASTSPSD